MTNAAKDGAVMDVNTQMMRTNIGNEMWHTDSTYKPIASKVAMLTARVLPPGWPGRAETALPVRTAGMGRGELPRQSDGAGQ